MSFSKKLFFLLFVMLCMMSSSSLAGNLEKGIALYENKQFNTAFPLIKNEAKQGDAYAQFLLGVMYRWGKGTPKNLECAIYWYTKSANQGNPKAQNNLANLYINGIGVEKNAQKAYDFYSLSAAQGTAEAQFGLGMMYRSGDGIQQDYSKALALFNAAATQEHVLSMHVLGLMYQFGEGVPIDIDKAVYWYKKAAAKGYTDSMWNLSTIYLPEDIHDIKGWEEVHHWYTLGMQHGDKANAPFGLGLIYLLGRGNYTIDNDKAASLFTLAAENGKADAWYWLGVMEEYGFGRPQNEEKAMALYRKAADAGVEPAINRLEHGHRDWSLKLFKKLRPLFGP